MNGEHQITHMKYLLPILISSLWHISLAQTPEWTQNTRGHRYAYPFEIGENGSVYTYGELSTYLDYDNFRLSKGGFVLKSDSNGRAVAGASFGAETSVNSLVIDKSDAQYIIYDSSNTHIIIKKAKTGHRIWTQSLGKVSTNPLVPYRSCVLSNGPSGYLQVLDRQWTHGKKSKVILRLLNKSTGKIVWSTQLLRKQNGPSRQILTVFDNLDKIYLGIDVAKGTQIIQFDTSGTPIDSATIVGLSRLKQLTIANGNLIVSTNFTKQLNYGKHTLKGSNEGNGALLVFDKSLKLLNHAILTAKYDLYLIDTEADQNGGLWVAGKSPNMLLLNGDTLMKFDPSGHFLLHLDKSLKHLSLTPFHRMGLSHISKKGRNVIVSGNDMWGGKLGSYEVPDSEGGRPYLSKIRIESRQQKSAVLKVSLTINTEQGIKPLSNHWFTGSYRSKETFKRFSGKTDGNGKATITLKDIDNFSLINLKSQYTPADGIVRYIDKFEYYTEQPDLLIEGVINYKFIHNCKAKFDLSFNQINQDTVVVSENSSNNSGQLLYEWHFGDGGVSGQRTPTHFYKSDGEYNLCLYIAAVENGEKVCRDDTCRTLTVKGSKNGFWLTVDKSLSLIPSQQMPDNISAFPNPFFGSSISLQGIEQSEFGLRLFDLNGKMIRDLGKFNFYNDRVALDLPNLQPGTYLLEISSIKGYRVIRLVKS